MEIAKPRACADIAIFRRTDEGAKVMLVKRGEEPFKGMLCLPGGLIREFEQPEMAARRKIREETGLWVRDLTLAFVTSEPCHDPRGWTLSTLFYGEDSFFENKSIKPGPAEEAVEWHTVGTIHLLENVVPGFSALISRLYERWMKERR